MKALMVESSAREASHSFLLDDDSTIPFTQEDIGALMDDKARVEAAGPRGGRVAGWQMLARQLLVRVAAAACQPRLLPSLRAGPAG